MNFKMFIAVLMLMFSFCSVKEVNIVNASDTTVAQDEMVLNVIKMIDSLPNECSLKDEESVKKCRAAFENLSSSQKVEVNNLLVLLEKENQIAVLYSEINYVASLIETLPDVENFDIDKEQKLNEVMSKYNDLDNLQKSLVNNYQKLLNLSSKLNKIYNAIEEITILINNLPSKDLIDNSIYNSVDKIEIIYNTMSDLQKQKISNLNIYLEIKDTIKKIEILKASIDNIPKQLTNDYFSILENIQNEYLKLSPSQKTMVTNYETFYSLYLSILDAQEFNDSINELINYINLENKYLLDYLFEKYNSFNDNQKVFITNYQKLIMTQEKIEEEEMYFEQAKVVIELINKLPLDISLENKELVREVRLKYDSLHDNSKKYIDNYHLLLEAEVKISKLENDEYAKSLDELYDELNKTLDDVSNIKEETIKNEEESKKLIEDIKKFIEDTKENEEKGFNKYIIIAIGLVSVFIIVAIIYIFSLNHKKISIDNEQI